MRLDMTSRRTISTMLLVWSLGLAGCSTLDFLPYNYMCKHHASNACREQCCNEHLVSERLAVAGDDHNPGLPLAQPEQDFQVPLSDIRALQEQVAELTEENSTMLDQIVTLDRQIAEQEVDQEEFRSDMTQNFSRELESLRQELSDYQSEVAGVADLLNRHHDTNQKVWDSVEQQIDDVLTHYDL